MKANEIREDILNYIAKEIETSVSRLGIDTKVKFNLYEEHGIYKLSMESTPFKTVPAMFKEIFLWGMCWVDETEEETSFTIIIKYAYEHWDGGSNGCELGNMRFVIDNDIPSAEKIENSPFISMRTYVKKVKGIEI